jgi:hypothetical protein
MSLPSRHAVLACAALAVASVVAAAAVAHGDPVGASRQAGGALQALLYWPYRLLARLPDRAADVLLQSPLHVVVLFFVAYLLAWMAARGAQRALARRLRG